jgi:glycosyltransferase involved in cell wall biosynthesis
MIHHCITHEYFEKGGGVRNYLLSLLKADVSNTSNKVLNSLKNICQGQYNLLHLHDKKLLNEVDGSCPTVFTLHNHFLYCPSGNKYFIQGQKICERQASITACLSGHLLNQCGSYRPHVVFNRLFDTFRSSSRIKAKNINVIANSNYVRSQLLLNGFNDQTVTTVLYGLNRPQRTVSELDNKTHGNRRLLFTGRIVPQKGLELLLKALSLTDQSIQLDIAGDGWHLGEVKNVAINLGVNHRITWHGWCNSDQLNHLYQECCAVVFPSVWPEPAGLVSLEAYTQRRPVIATQVGGIPEYIQPQKTGLLVPPNQPEILADAIESVVNDYTLAKQLAENGHRLFEAKFTMEHHVNQLEKVYEKVIDDF